MRIAILGSGLMGAALGTLWARRGHDVTFTYSRDQEKLQRLAHDTRPHGHTAPPADALAQSDIVLIAVPWHRLDDALAAAGGARAFADRVVLTCSLPMTEDDSDLAIGHTSSGAEELAKRLPGIPIAAVFNTIPSELFTDPILMSAPKPPSVIGCGDPVAKEVAAVLAEETGFEFLDAGELRIARWLEPFGLLVGQLAYAQELGPALAYRILRDESPR